MRRVQIHLEEDLDDAAAEAAARRGISKAALIRASLAETLSSQPGLEAAWDDMTGWVEDGGMEDLDEVAYGPALRP